MTLSKILLNEKEIQDIQCGKSVRLSIKPDTAINSELQILDNNNILVAVGILDNNCIIKPKKVLIKNEH